MRRRVARPRLNGPTPQVDGPTPHVYWHLRPGLSLIPTTIVTPRGRPPCPLRESDHRDLGILTRGPTQLPSESSITSTSESITSTVTVASASDTPEPPETPETDP